MVMIKIFYLIAALSLASTVYSQTAAEYFYRGNTNYSNKDFKKAITLKSGIKATLRLHNRYSQL